MRAANGSHGDPDERSKIGNRDEPTPTSRRDGPARRPDIREGHPPTGRSGPSRRVCGHRRRQRELGHLRRPSRGSEASADAEPGRHRRLAAPGRVPGTAPLRGSPPSELRVTEGVVNAAYEPAMALTIPRPARQSVEVEAAMDTGSTGLMTVSPALAAGLALALEGSSRGTPADGRTEARAPRRYRAPAEPPVHSALQFAVVGRGAL